MRRDEEERSERRVIFLDIDGVLQPTSNQDRFDHDMDALKEELARKYDEPGYLELDKYDVAAVYYDWDERAVKELKQLLDESHAEIVLSSDWRLTKNLDQMRLLFKLHGLDGYLKELVPNTKEFSDKPDDIPVYLENHPDLYYYCVIDDRFMGEYFPGRFVYVGYRYYSLRAKQRMEAANILINGPWWDQGNQETRFANRWKYRSPEESEIPEIHDGIKKAIFLDFDGVVNDDLGSQGDGVAVRDYTIEYLSRIVYETKADIVFSSSRRLDLEDYFKGNMDSSSLFYKDYETFNKLLANNGLMVKGMTPIIGSGPYARPAEIRSWLARRPDVEGFVILDDDGFWVWDELEDHFVRTISTDGCYDEDGRLIKEPPRGMTLSHMYRAIEVLNEKPMPRLKAPFVLEPI